MSLNGLDHVAVMAAYQAALAEAGGWFLLKYAARDQVEILTRGTGGAADARGAIARYDQKSPLYGFLLYRRRKVLIKYVPDGTSRLLQARVAVHFTAVTDKFTPHDTTISISSADELSDSALTSACSLHTAAPSSSSSNSSRHKLDEITEDAEEGQSTAGDSAATPRPASQAAPTPTVVEPPAKAEGDPAAQSPETKLDDGKLTPEFSHVSIETVTEKAELRNEDHDPATAPHRESFKNYDSLFENGPDPRLSSQTTRPALSDLYAEIYAQYNKPKVKLGPRPKASLDIKRPHTSGNGAANAVRAVSSLPPGLRSANRKTPEPKRPKSRDSSAVPSIALPPPPPVPTVPEIPPSPSYAPKSPASVRSLPVHVYGGQKPTGASAEKLRLMKALELRKKQMKARKEREERAAEAARTAALTAEGEAKTAEPEDQEPPTTEACTNDKESQTSAVREESASPPDYVEEPTVPEDPAFEKPPSDDSKPVLAQDLDVGMVSCQSEVDDMHSAASACSPISAQTQDSSCAPSTRPSSISEDDQQLHGGAKPASSAQSTLPRDPEPSEDEVKSVESTPTVVPESVTSVSGTEAPSQVDDTTGVVPQASLSESLLAHRNKRESMIVTPPASSLDDRFSRTRANRESMLFIPVPDDGSLQSRRKKRESMTLAGPSAEPTGESKDKRYLTVDPVHASAENSEAEYLSDDSFMEELQSAKFEEAMPVSVSISKSPITPYFPRKPSVSDGIPQRSASQQTKPGRLTSEQLSRKPSGPWFTHANSDAVVVAKKINVSSGISQRIKALAEKSNRDSTASVSPVATPDASHSLVAQRKSSFFTTPPSGNSPPGKSAQRFHRSSFIVSKSTSTSPDNKPVLQPQPPPSTDMKKGPVYNVHNSERPDSVQVTARIIRDPRVQRPTLTMPTESTPLDLHKSPIIIDHQKSTQHPSRSKSASPSAEPTSPKSPTQSKDAGPAIPRSSSESSWRSFGRRLSESKSSVPRTQSAHSIESNEEKQEKKEKKDSRTTKLFKRMSSAASMARKNSSASFVQEEPHNSLPSLREPPPPMQVGDLNIQFPDTLLWKRRWVEIDASGNLVLSLSKSNEQSKGITKRFHLTEFRIPYAPDQDRQELPNSVVLDFVDGRTLQCACETYTAQAQVLQILREAHDAWRAYDQGR